MRLKLLAKSAAAALLWITLWMASFAPVLAAGTTPLALAIQRDSEGNDTPGCLVNFYVAGTVATPQNAFADFGLTTSLGPVLTCDQAGRVPMHWLADGLIHVRLTTAAGTPIVDTTLQVLGPSSGGGGGGGVTIDPTTIFATGDEKTRYGIGALTGWVRENGLTLGNATSGATERANADTQALWIYLYTTDANLAVSGGRTGNALNDYNANKQLTLPDMRGRGDWFLADMGNSASTVLTAATCASPLVLGFACGNQTYTVLPANLPPYTPSVSSLVTTAVWQPVQSGAGIGAYVPSTTGSGALSTGINTTAVFNAQGGTSTPFGIIPPIMLKTKYIKL